MVKQHYMCSSYRCDQLWSCSHLCSAFNSPPDTADLALHCPISCHLLAQPAVSGLKKSAAQQKDLSVLGIWEHPLGLEELLIDAAILSEHARWTESRSHFVHPLMSFSLLSLGHIRKLRAATGSVFTGKPDSTAVRASDYV